MPRLGGNAGNGCANGSLSLKSKSSSYVGGSHGGRNEEPDRPRLDHP